MKNNALIQAMLKSDTPDKDMKQGLVLGVAFAALTAFAMPSEAQDPIADDELCEKAVSYAVKYIPEENGGTLHQARWNIIDGNRTDDMQKLVSLVVFEMGQRISYIYDSEKDGPADEYFPIRISAMREACESAVVEMRGNGFGDIESANPEEAW